MKEEINLIWNKLENWYSILIEMLPNIVVAISVAIIVVYLAKAVKILIQKYLFKRWQNEELKTIFSKVIQFVIIVVGFLFALSIVNLDKTVTSILAGVGVVGIALGFAFQDIAANFMSGLFMAANKPFKIGDIIKVNEITGKIQEIKLRTTSIKTFQGNDVIIPNTELFQNAVTNYTYTKERRIDLSVGVSYNDDLELAKQTAIEAVKQVNGIKLENGIDVLFMEFGDSSINFEVRFWIPNGKTKSWLQAQSDAIQEIKKAYDREGISIPFPIRTLDLSGNEGVLRSLTANQQQ